jgi:site-specific DNA-methyltransferase (adenine-specific)
MRADRLRELRLERGETAENVARAIESWLNKVHCGDCVDLMARMPAESIDLIVTSPPYNVRNSTGNGLKDGRGGKWANAVLLKGYGDYDDAMPHDEYVAWQRSCLEAMMRVLRRRNSLYCWKFTQTRRGMDAKEKDVRIGAPSRIL